MVKRDKKLNKSIESFKEQIELHFKKIEEDILNDDPILANYHIKEIDKSLINAIKHKMDLLGKLDINLLKEYEQKLLKLKNKLEKL